MAVSGTGGSHSASLGLMSCVRESSPPDGVDAEEIHHEPKKRRFHPLRGLRRMFRRKERRPPEVVTISADELSGSTPETQIQGEVRSRSATILIESKTRRRSGNGLHSAGLSVSHDSIFSPEQRSAAESGSELDVESSSSLSVQRLATARTGVQAELLDAVRRRRARDENTSDDEEDLGLPRSPSSNSPTTADVLLEKVLKENVNKSSHSTCSDGSLLSMGSSEMDEDSFGQSSRHSSKLSLHDKRPPSTVHVNPPEPDLEVEEVTSAPLSHSAARHKMAVKPKRTHGAPRRRRVTQLVGVASLPATPEVNEEVSSSVSGRSGTPDLTDIKLQRESHASSPPYITAQLKSASLPPGSAPTWEDNPVKLSRSRSSATNRHLDSTTVGEQDEPESAKKEETSFFGRLLSRRSGKKKKVIEESSLDLPQKRMDEKGRYVHEVTKFGRHHPASRQRIEPINIPEEKSVTRMHVSYSAPSPPNSPLLSEEILQKENEITIETKFVTGQRVIPVDIDLALQRRSLVKKSHSFRRDEALPFVSLDTPSLPVGIGADIDKEIINDLDDSQECSTSDIIDSIEQIGVRNESMVEDIRKAQEAEHFQVFIQNEEIESTSENTIKKSVTAESISECVSKVFKSNSASNESINHQMTIPVGTSVVNITQDVEPIKDIIKPEHTIKPEPRKSLNIEKTKEDVSKEIPLFHPIPAPRLSKRGSVETQTAGVPEFLRVQLNHVDSKPAVNVVLSTNSNSDFQKTLETSSLITEHKDSVQTIKEVHNETKVSVIGMSGKSEEIEVKTETKIEDLKQDIYVKKTEQLTTANEPIDPNQVKVLNVSKQWTSAPMSITNQKYSVVSITSNGKIESSEISVSSNQILQQTNTVRDIGSSTQVEKVQCSVVSTKETSPVKIVFRQKSFCTDDKPKRQLSTEKLNGDETLVKSPFRKISDSEKGRKLSIDKLETKNDPVLRKSYESIGSDENVVDRNSFGSTDTLGSQDGCEVVLRRKSLSRDVSKQKDEEPELLKVFARRSLKIKDCDIPDELEMISDNPLKSRDSDKENECGDSPPEERKKIKEPLIESKVRLESSEKSGNVVYKYQRSVSSNCDDVSNTSSILPLHRKENNSYEKRQRSRTMPDTKIIDPPTSKITHRVLTNMYKEKEVEVISLDRPDEKRDQDENVPKFKRIQQRKEEWEKRAQMAMKKTHP